MKLADLSTPVAALALLMAGHRDLPAPAIDINAIFPKRLRLSFHNKPGAFDAWLTALAIDPTTVTERGQSDGETNVRKVIGQYAGATVELIEFIDAAERGEGSG